MPAALTFKLVNAVPLPTAALKLVVPASVILKFVAPLTVPLNVTPLPLIAVSGVVKLIAPLYV